MILTKQAILERLGLEIVISPFKEERLNPNSYNLTLGSKILTYDNVANPAYGDARLKYAPLDPKKQNPYTINEIPEEGMILFPGELYLCQTAEYTETRELVPMIEGRSSWGRLGLFVHVTAGFGDVGFCGYWTLELMVVKPLIVYPGMEIAQIFYHMPHGECTEYESKKYQHNRGVQPSMLWKEFVNDENSNARSANIPPREDRTAPRGMCDGDPTQ